MTGTPAAPANEVYVTFASGIDNAAVQKIFAATGTAMASRVTHLHMLFQSFGGSVGDGICLYNFFRTLPLDVTLYNAGAVESIATLIFLGAKKRKASAHATFMIHRTTSRVESATASRLQAVTKSLLLDDERTEAILRQHLKLSDEQWRDLTHNDLTFSAKEAVAAGFADEIAEFSPPAGTQVFNV